MNLLLTLLKLAWPLLKEYGISSLRLKKTNGRLFAIIVGFVGLVYMAGLVAYLAEQANQNLELHQPLIEQYNALAKDHYKLQVELDTTRNQYHICERKFGELITTCSAVKTSGSDEVNYIYDTERKVMIPVK